MDFRWGLHFDFQVRELIFTTINLNSYRRTGSRFSRFETDYEERRVAKHIETAVQFTQMFMSRGKLRSATFAFSGLNLEHLKLGRQKLLHHQDVKLWSKVTRVRCEIFLKWFRYFSMCWCRNKQIHNFISSENSALICFYCTFWENLRLFIII